RKLKLPEATVSHLRQSGNAQIASLATKLSNGNEAGPLTDACHRTHAVKPAVAKFGTMADHVQSANSDIPYVLRIPLAYSHDRPSPLLIYLSGSSGLAMDGVNTAEDVVSSTGYLVLYPHAADHWWKPEVARRFDAVLQQVFERYNVDRDRVYIAGFSNGGTGALYMADFWPPPLAAL